MIIEHAPIAPSGLHTTVECPGNVKLSKPFLDQPRTEEQLEGDAAHWVALMMAYGIPGDQLINTTHTNGVLITDEMIDGGQMYVDALEGIPGIAEQRVEITRIHPSLCWGFPDYRQYVPSTKRLRIVDYKFGHRYVEEFENWQLIAYAAGLLETLGLDDSETILELMIVQPRCYHPDGPVRTWTVGASVIRPLVNRLFHAAAEALSDKPVTHTGDWCLDCLARSVCTTLQKSTAAIVDFTGGADPVIQTPADVGVELRILHAAAKRIEARITGKEEQALAMIRAGKPVPFYTIGASQPRQVWSVPVKEVALLGEIYGVNLLKPPEPITPKQAITKGVAADTIVKYSFTPNGKHKLVADSTLKARKVFSQ